MQRKLCRFTHCADEDEQRHGRRRVDVHPGPQGQGHRRIAGPREQLLELERAIELIGERNTSEEGCIGHAQERERLEGPSQRAGMAMVMREYVEEIAENLPEE